MNDIRDNPKGFNAATLKVIEALGGDVRTGKCFCPVHDDGSSPSLQVNNGRKLPVVIHCFGGGGDHDREIINKLVEMGVWPSSSKLGSEKIVASSGQQTEAERLAFARTIYEELLASKGREFAVILTDYLSSRGIQQVPGSALVSLPIELEGITVHSEDPAMVLPIRDKQGELKGIHATWLNASMTAKRTADPQRQSFGLVKGNFVQLTDEIDWANPPTKLCIAEGVETTLSMMQLTGLPGIATGGLGFFKDLDPPRCAEYIIAPDNSDGDSGRRAVGLLAQRLVAAGAVVRIALPERPTGGKPGYDWNDALVAAAADPDKLTRSILEAPLFTDIWTDAEKRDVCLSGLAELKLKDPVSYEAERKAAAAALGIRLPVLDAEVDRRVTTIKATQQASSPAPNIQQLADSGREIIECEDVLGLFANDFRRLIAGEEAVAKLIYLVGTSRLFEKAMHAAIKGPSSGGKSAIRKNVLKFFPPEAVISFTALSEKALIYSEEDFAHKILSMGEAFSNEEAKFQDYLLRELMSENKLLYQVPMKVGDTIKTITIEKNGPVAFIVTTTRNSLNPENETRMLSLEVDDSEKQTKHVLRRLATVEGLNEQVVDADLAPWHDYQRFLGAGERVVVIPWAPILAELMGATKSVRLRRDFSQLMCAVKAHALLHREHRSRSAEGWIVATIAEDYAEVYELMKDLLATTAELKVHRNIVQTVEAVRKRQGGDGAKVSEIKDELNLDRSATFRRLQAAERAGYVINLEDRRGRPGRYEASEGEPSAVSELLPSPEALQQRVDELQSEKRGSSCCVPETD